MVRLEVGLVEGRAADDKRVQRRLQRWRWRPRPLPQTTHPERLGRRGSGAHLEGHARGGGRQAVDTGPGSCIPAALVVMSRDGRSPLPKFHRVLDGARTIK